MTHIKISLASDNWSSVHPLALQAIVEANPGSAAPYGSDPWTEQASILIQKALHAPCKVFMVPNGTGANVLGLTIACRRHESILCTDIAHIEVQESGATESIVGSKLVTVPHQEGKITPEAVLKKLTSERAFGKHATCPRVLSITQPTEVGTVYQLEELSAISALCQRENLLLHIDGSRFYNAAVSLNVSLKDMVLAAKPDVLSLGGTKNGLMSAEALVIFNPALQNGSDHRHKQTLQLLSKMRYLSAQYIPFFTNDLWHTLASAANQRAQEIEAVLQTIPEISVSYPVETNQIFFTAPSLWIPLIQEKIACYPWDAEKNELRWITSWNTSEQDVQDVTSILQTLCANFST